MSASSIRVECLRGFRALGEVEQEWTALHSRDPRAGPWTSPSLLIAFHRIFQPGGVPAVLAAYDADQVLRGALPVSLETRRIGPFFVRHAQPLASWHSCFNDAVVDPAHASTVIPSLAHALAALPCDEITLTRVRPDAWIMDAACGFLPELRQLEREAGEPAPYVDLRADGPAMSSADGRELRRTHRRLAELGTLEIGWEPAGHAGRGATAEFVAMHTRLKVQQRQTKAFTLGSAAPDFPDWLAAESLSGRAGLFTLRLSGRMLAGCVILRAKTQACTYRAAWELDVAKYGVGVLLLSEAMVACRAAGDTMFELGPGRETYKNKWRPSIRELATLQLIRRNWRTRAANAWLRARRLG